MSRSEAQFIFTVNSDGTFAVRADDRECYNSVYNAIISEATAIALAAAVDNVLTPTTAPVTRFVKKAARLREGEAQRQREIIERAQKRLKELEG